MKRLEPNGTLRVFEGKPHLIFQVRNQDEILTLIDDWLDASGDVEPAGDNALCAS